MHSLVRMAFHLESVRPARNRVWAARTQRVRRELVRSDREGAEGHVVAPSCRAPPAGTQRYATPAVTKPGRQATQVRQLPARALGNARKTRSRHRRRHAATGKLDRLVPARLASGRAPSRTTTARCRAIRGRAATAISAARIPSVGLRTIPGCCRSFVNNGCARCPDELILKRNSGSADYAIGSIRRRVRRHDGLGSARTGQGTPRQPSRQC
jgi:hypothetical protein